MIKLLLVLLIFLNINAITAKTELTIIISYDEQSNLEDHFDSFVIDSSEQLTLEGCYSLRARNESRSLESLHRYCSSIVDAVQYLGTDNEFYILIQCNIEIAILNHWHFIAANGVDYFVLLGDKTSYDVRVLLVELILRKYSYVPQQGKTC